MAKAFDIAVIGAGPAAMAAAEVLAKSKRPVAYINGFSFQEQAMAAAMFLNSPEEHVKWTSGDPQKWKPKWDNVEVFLSSVECLDCDKKEITLMNTGPNAGAVLSYKIVIVATGQKCPLICPTPGMTLSERISEVQACGSALKKAKTVVFNGAGLVGLEMCGDFRAKNGYGARVILLSRSGKVLDTDYGEKSEKPDPQMVAKVTEILTTKYKIELKQGSIADPKSQEPSLSPGSFQLDNGEALDFDVYIPCYSPGPNTGFMRSSSPMLDARGALMVNDYLQSSVHPEVFAVNVGNKKFPGHPVFQTIQAAAKHCAKQAMAILDNKQPGPFVYKSESPHPANVKIGHGQGGYMIWSGLPGPATLS